MTGFADTIDLLSHAFIQKALVAGCFVALSCSLLGVFLVLRRLSLIGDGLAHVSFGAVAVGLFLRVYPLYVAIPLVMASSLGIVKLGEKARLYGDAAIGIVSSAGIATGVILASLAGGFNVDLFSFLFGNILAVGTGEMALSAVLAAITVIAVVLYYRPLVAVTFDEELAAASGIRTRKLNLLLVLLTAVTVVLAMRVVGVMLISALLILPPVSALQAERGFAATLVISCVLGVFTVVAGIVISFVTDLPTGATIVILNLLVFLGSLGRRVIRG